LAAVASTTLSRASRHSADILESPVFKPLGLSPDFVPQKSCLEYVQDECARALPEIRPHVQALVQAAREVTRLVRPRHGTNMLAIERVSRASKW
jgi:hypothetical protein